MQETFNDRYREFLMGAAGLLIFGILFLRDQATLGLQLAAGAGLLLFVARLV